jgi:hypothetical protein
MPVVNQRQMWRPVLLNRVKTVARVSNLQMLMDFGARARLALMGHCVQILCRSMDQETVQFN